jgi:hypothetical protein
LLPATYRPVRRNLRKENVVKTKIMRALAAALIAGTLLITGVAPLGAPGVDGAVVSFGQ